MNIRHPCVRSLIIDSPDECGFEERLKVKTKKPATKNEAASTMMANPDPKKATNNPPTALPTIRPALLATLIYAFAGCRCSSSTTSGTKPGYAGYHNPLSAPDIADRITSKGTVAVPVMNSTAITATTRLIAMSLAAMTRARPRRSAITPPIGSTITIGKAWAARTKLNEVGVAPSSSKIPNASAIGAIPLPILLIVRAMKSF
ncbi:unannotated protein [freshwater metagenome]|uniref:Unannotated protein n=1 Tax=freshwater metagenome TaxID=449393 RepID=A0A6J7ASB3_9ZZZZ